MTSINAFNHRWARVLIEALTRHQVRHICIAPGSRSTPLTLAAAAHQQLLCHTHFDERGLGHLALGLAKTTQQPVAMIVTSGTAVANLYPAIIEASLTGERLIVLSADRPVELIDCGANQAIRQIGIFSSYPHKTLNLPTPSQAISAAWLVSAIDEQIGTLDHGVLHINCPFPEPLYGDENTDDNWSAMLGSWWQNTKPWLMMTTPSLTTYETERLWPAWQHKKGLVIVGRVSAAEGEQIRLWANTLGWPLLGDVLSQTGQPLPCADLWLDHPKAVALLAQTQWVIQFGCSLTGKRLLQWQAQCQPEEYWLIAPQSGRQDPAQHRGRRIITSISHWIENHPASAQPAWCAELTALSQLAKRQVTSYFSGQLSEAALAHRLDELLPQQGQLFVGNSLIIRLIDALAQLPVGYPVYSNRGASGIDGLISTAAGVQRGAGKPTLIILGDLSALYDLNSLILLRKKSIPTVIMVVNNDGGGIFSLLPTPEAEHRQFYQMPHGLDFAHAAALFGLNYACPEDWQALVKSVQQAWQQSETRLIEIKVPAKQGAESLQQLRQQISKL